jgi:hypothetical protein
VRRVLLAILALCVATPVFAQTAPRAERRQETVELGNNRFLIFSGEPNGEQHAYTADLIVIQNNIPRMEPLFAEEYVFATNSANITEGIAFIASDFNFDKSTQTLTFNTHDADRHARFTYKYTLAVDMLTLREVWGQKDNEPNAKPEIIYKASK